MANAITSKEFNSKKAAQAAARKVYGAEYATLVTIDTLDEKWYVSEIVEEPQTDAAPEETAPVADAQKLEAEVGMVGADQVLADEIGNEDPTDDEINESNEDPQSDLASLLAYQTGEKVIIEPQKPKSEPQKTSGLVIEKNRPEQNGVKRPSAGGLCRAVWDACWAHQEATGEVPTAKEVKAIAETNGWNPNNASIEYYQWRKFNGITGRVKAAPAQAEVETKVEGE